MRARTLISAIIVFLLVVVGLGLTQEKTNVTINKVRAPHTSPASGEQMYVSYCASCHGKDGKGNGPAAPALKVPATDLTSLAKQNKGTFPSAHVSTILTGGAVAAHGSADMPVWGPIFRSLSTGHQSEVQQRVMNLTKYIESMQVK
jgi:mono/diheme cytochrome c family protein